MGAFSTIFINRPIMASVISIVIVLLGALSVPLLPVASMPDITPPTVKVTTSYPGANANVVEETVTAPIEQEVNGVEDMLYMASKSGSDGSLDLTVTFAIGTDPDMSTVLTQNRVNIAMPVLPEDVTRQGVKVEKIAAIWDYETSPLFDAAERAALRVAQLAAQVPNAVEDADFDALRPHFSDDQIVEIVSAISLFGFFNRFNDTLAMPLEEPVAQFAGDLLAGAGWKIGKHGAGETR